MNDFIWLRQCFYETVGTAASRRRPVAHRVPKHFRVVMKDFVAIELFRAIYLYDRFLPWEISADASC